MMMKPLEDHPWQSTAELKAHYAAVHKRLFDRPRREEPPQTKYEKKVFFGIATEKVLEMTAAFYKTSKREVMHGSHSGLVRVRHITFYLAYYIGKKNLRHIAKVMECHLNTVSSGIQRVMGDRRRHDATMVSEMQVLTNQLEALPWK